MTRGTRVLAWTGLLGFALSLRLGLALGSPSIFFPDEIFQTLEPAHRLVFGYGVISWEWRLGIRSWVLPAFLAGAMRATAWMGSGSTGLPAGNDDRSGADFAHHGLVRLCLGQARQRNGCRGRRRSRLLVLTSGWFTSPPRRSLKWLPRTSCCPASTSASTAQSLGERKRLFLAGLFCALAACLRIQLLPGGCLRDAVLLLSALARDGRPQSPPEQPCRCSCSARRTGSRGPIPGSRSSATTRPTSSSGPGKLFWIEPWYWYLLVLVVLIGPAILLLFHGARRSPFLAIFCAIVVASHSVIPHKEIRFIYPILAPAIALAAMGAVDLLAESGAERGSSPIREWVVAIGMVFLLASSALLARMRGLVQRRPGASALRSPGPRAGGLRRGNLRSDVVGVRRLHASPSRCVQSFQVENASRFRAGRCVLQRPDCAGRCRRASRRDSSASSAGKESACSSGRGAARLRHADKELNEYLRENRAVAAALHCARRTGTQLGAAGYSGRDVFDHRCFRFRFRRIDCPARAHRAASGGPLRVSRRHGASALRFQVSAHHRALRRAKRAVPGPRAGSGVPRHRLQHSQRAGSGRHSGGRPGSGAGRHRARRRRGPRRHSHRRRAGDRHRGHRAQPCLSGRLPRARAAHPGKGLPAAGAAGRGRLDRSPGHRRCDRDLSERACAPRLRPTAWIRIRWCWAARTTRCCGPSSKEPCGRARR